MKKSGEYDSVVVVLLVEGDVAGRSGLIMPATEVTAGTADVTVGVRGG